MRSYNDWEEEIEENEPTQWPINNYAYSIDNRRTNYSSKPSYASKYNTSWATKNYGTAKKDYNYNFSHPSQNDESRNSTEYYSYNNKYLTVFNTRTRRNDQTNAKISDDGVIKGYTDNCTFYISGSSDLSDLKPKSTIFNKYQNRSDKKNEKYNNYNYNKYLSQNRPSRQNRIYESKTQVINPSDYIKKDEKKDTKSKYNQRNENKNNKNDYTSKTNINTRIYNINTTNDNNMYQKRNNHNIISPKKTTPKINNLNSNYSRKSYYETEPNYNLRNYNNRNSNTDNIKRPLIPSKNISNIEPKATIQNINKANNTDNNRRKMYKTSTNTNFEEKIKNNYYQKIVQKNSYQSQKRNNTPNLSSRLESKNINTTTHYTFQRSTGEGKSLIPNRNNHKSMIPHNKGYRYKNDEDIRENILNKTDRNIEPKCTLQRKNSNSNISNKSRYNFPERPKLREYGTKTEVHSFSSINFTRGLFNNKEREIEKLYEIPFKKDKDKETNHVREYKKIEPKNRYQPRSFSITPANREGKKYGVQTETIAMNRNRNYSRNNEYEVTDIVLYKKKQQEKEKNSLSKNIPKYVKLINQPNKVIDNKKEYTSFERSLRNIKDNRKEIEKEKNYFNNKGKYDNISTIFISDFSKDKKKYRTSTQKQAFRSHGYTLSSANEYEVPKPVKKNQNYEKIEINKNKYENNDRYKNINNINRNNYFNAMKNLEEEIEVDDDNEQVEYYPPKPLTKIDSKPKGNKYSYNINKSSQINPENESNYTIKREEKEKTKYNKDIKNNKEKPPIGNSKKYNVPKTKDKIEQTKNNYSSINTSKDEKKNEKDKVNKSQEQKRNHQYIPQNIQKKPIIVPQKKENLKAQPQRQIQKNIQIQSQTHQQNYPEKENQIKMEEQKEEEIRPEQQKLEKVHQIVEYIEEEDHNIQENENEEEIDEENENIEAFQQKEENNNLKKPKYSSYFGDFNNNYYEIKGVSASGKKEEEEEEENEAGEENENDKKNYIQEVQPVRNITFDIHSENLMVPAEEQDDKEEKEADEQLIEEDEQNDVNNDDENEEENEHVDAEHLGEENDGEEHENYQENGNEEEGEIVGDEMVNEEENGNENEEYDENEYEGEEIEDNVIEENNLNEEEENNENEKE